VHFEVVEVVEVVVEVVVDVVFVVADVDVVVVVAYVDVAVAVVFDVVFDDVVVLHDTLRWFGFMNTSYDHGRLNVCNFLGKLIVAKPQPGKFRFPIAAPCINDGWPNLFADVHVPVF
jgi:hypothetical protein